MLKLFNCVAVSVECDIMKTLVAHSEEEALSLFEAMLDENESTHFGAVANEVQIDGYEITVTKV